MTMRAHSLAVTTLTYSDDGGTLVSASQWGDSVARIWDARTGRLLVSVRNGSAPMQTATFAPGGRTLATADREGSLRLWDATTGRELETLQGNDNSPCALAFSPDGRTLAAGGVGQTIWTWDVSGITRRNGVSFICLFKEISSISHFRFLLGFLLAISKCGNYAIHFRNYVTIPRFNQQIFEC